jgi:hypothetical protein
MNKLPDIDSSALLVELLARELARHILPILRDELAKAQPQTDPLAKYPDRMTKAQIAEYFSATTKTVGNWAKTGKLPRPVYFKGKATWQKSEVLKLIKL